MDITNKYGAPDAIMRAVTEADDYDRGDSWRTVTELINPPQIVELTRRHGTEIIKDVNDMSYVFYGRVAHEIMRLSGETPLALLLDDERLYAEIQVKENETGLPGFFKIGGKPDNVSAVKLGDDALRITDWKFVGARSITDGLKPEWEAQINLYALLLREYGFRVTELRTICLLRDWTPYQAQQGNHPPTWWREFDVPVWKPTDAVVYLLKRVHAHRHADIFGDDELPECTPEERWARGNAWALMKSGRKSALAVRNTRGELWQAAEARGLVGSHGVLTGGAYIEYRPQDNVRCAQHCDAAPFCHQWARLKAQSGTEEA